MQDILKKIISKKKERINKYKQNLSINRLLSSIKKIENLVEFKKKIITKAKRNEISIIAEIKKASPSAGILLKDFDYMRVAKEYVENGASFLSVLTEEDFFFGKLDFIKNIKKKYHIPILCKDFFIDSYQVPLAKTFGADCILIILSAVDKELAKDLYQTAKEINIDTLIEVHSKEEAEFALSFDNSLIGINNRNLKTLKVSLNTTIELAKILESHKYPLISESGIDSVDKIKFINDKTGIKSFLIGESLLKSDNIGSKLRSLSKISL